MTNQNLTQDEADDELLRELDLPENYGQNLKEPKYTNAEKFNLILYDKLLEITPIFASITETVDFWEALSPRSTALTMLLKTRAHVVCDVGEAQAIYLTCKILGLKVGSDELHTYLNA